MKYQRLQGKDFAEIKAGCKMKGFSITKAGNILAFVEQKKTGWKIKHYLNDEEKIKLVNSDYFKQALGRKKLIYNNTVVVYDVPTSENDLEINFNKDVKPSIKDISFQGEFFNELTSYDISRMSKEEYEKVADEVIQVLYKDSDTKELVCLIKKVV